GQPRRAGRAGAGLRFHARLARRDQPRPLLGRPAGAGDQICQAHRGIDRGARCVTIDESGARRHNSGSRPLPGLTEARFGAAPPRPAEAAATLRTPTRPIPPPAPPKAPPAPRPPVPPPKPPPQGLPSAAPFKGPLLGAAEAPPDAAPTREPVLSSAQYVEDAQ